MEGDAAAFIGFDGVVGDFPEADDLAFGSGDREGAAESVDALMLEVVPSPVSQGLYRL